MKECKKCKQTKPLNEFHKSKRHSMGRKNECAECTNEYLRAHYYKDHKESRKKSRINYYKRKYGISYSEYESMCLAVGMKCEICHIPGRTSAEIAEVGSPNVLVLDHCHITGKIRGILCRDCNTGIGSLQDDPNLLRNAVQYLERN